MADEMRVPVICLDRSSTAAVAVFNSNEWARQGTRGVLQSCASEFGTLHYTVDRLGTVVASGREACRDAMAQLQAAWASEAPRVDQVRCFAQVPELHLLIEAFFSGLKTLLDLVVQVLPTEGCVTVPLDGFHRSRETYGGVVINALERNVPKGKKPLASAVRALLLLHQDRWIDEAIRARDALVHPAKGMQQVMFELVVAREDDGLVLVEARPPQIGGRPIHEYALDRLSDVRTLSIELLSEVRRAA